MCILFPILAAAVPQRTKQMALENKNMIGRVCAIKPRQLIVELVLAKGRSLKNVTIAEPILKLSCGEKWLLYVSTTVSRLHAMTFFSDNISN